MTSDTQQIATGFEAIGKDFVCQEIVYGGGNFYAEGCSFKDCSFVLTGPAANTVRFMALIEQYMPGSIKRWFEMVGHTTAIDITDCTTNNEHLIYEDGSPGPAWSDIAKE